LKTLHFFFSSQPLALPAAFQRVFFAAGVEMRGSGRRSKAPREDLILAFRALLRRIRLVEPTPTDFLLAGERLFHGSRKARPFIWDGAETAIREIFLFRPLVPGGGRCFQGKIFSGPRDTSSSTVQFSLPGIGSEGPGLFRGILLLHVFGDNAIFFSRRGTEGPLLRAARLPEGGGRGRRPPSAKTGMGKMVRAGPFWRSTLRQRFFRRDQAGGFIR